MKRVLLLILVVALVATPLAAAQDAQAQAGDSNASTNETVEQLRERVDELENENSRLKSEVVSKNGQIEQLEFRLNQSQRDTGFSGDVSEGFREMGAWNPYTNEPAFLIWVESDDGGLYQYVGPNNGEHSFNGMSAWTQVLGGDAELLGNVTVDLLYAPEGIEEEHTYPSTQALSQIRQLVNQMNQPATRMAWERWNNEQRNSAESTERNTFLTLGILGAGLIWGAMHVESRKGIATSLRKKRMKRKKTESMLRITQGRWSFLLSIPVIGRIYEKYLKWRYEP